MPGMVYIQYISFTILALVPRYGVAFSQFRMSPKSSPLRSMSATSSNEEHIDAAGMTSSSSSSSSVDNDDDSGCPLSNFSMKYPRFRIPVSSGKDTNPFSIKGNMFSGIKMALDRATLERKYAADVKLNNFFWIEPTIDIADDDSDRTAKGKIGVFASAVVWRRVADSIDSYRRSDDGAGSAGRSVVSIPNASMAGLSQLADIMNWYNEQQGIEPLHAGNVKLEASVDKEAPIPTIILTVTKGVGGDALPKTEMSSEQVIDGTKSWVDRVLVKLGICPFTKSVTKSGQGLGDVGVPVGSIAYHHSSAGVNEIPHLMAGMYSTQLTLYYSNHHTIQSF